MKGYSSEQIRNIVLLGHGGSGKTTFAEAALAATGAITRMGRIEDGNTVGDYEKTEIEKKYSIATSLIPVEYNKCKINFIDTPGFFDFAGEVCSAVRAVEAAIIIVDASAGVQVGTEKAWDVCKKNSLPRIFLINKTDKENVNVDKVIDDLIAKFGNSVAAFSNKDALTEAIAENDEELMEKFFNGEEFTDEEFKNGLTQGIASAEIAPILTSSAIKQEGITELLDDIIKHVPSPLGRVFPAKNDKDEDIEVTCSPDGKLSAFVFKSIADPFSGKLNFVKVISGKIVKGTEVYNPSKEKVEKMGAVSFMRGKTSVETTEVVAGDIFVASKMPYARTGDTLCDKSNIVLFPRVEFPQPSLFLAIEAKAKGEDEKIGTGLIRLREEDPSFTIEQNVETAQRLLGGQGEIQIGIITKKLKDRFGVDVALVDPKVPYRETIKGTADVQGKHKKQSGGAGQYGDVWIRFSPSTEDFEFSEELFGGSVPKNYVPAVEKGLRESLLKGPLSGSRVTNIKAVLHDGSYHDVDSNEMAFKIAAAIAFKKGIDEAKPVLLEPVMHVEILVPDEYMGDVMGDMNKRRGKILGTEPQAGGGLKVIAEAPQAELFKYAINLRSMTQARGSFTMKFERYEEVPAMTAQKIKEEYKKGQESE